ncbi:MAG: AAA family ATPase [Candidatus Saccharimonadales bacterium]
MTFAPDLVLHNISRRQSEAFVKNPASGLIVHGIDGIGLQSYARAIARSLNSQPGGLLIVEGEDDKNISIDQIRELYHQTRSKRDHTLTVIIDDADTLRVEAQNAFLKLLEEPPENVVFIMLTHAPQHLLPTISSRAATIELRPISQQQSTDIIRAAGIKDSAKSAQLLFLASGRPALLNKLIQDSDFFDAQAEVIKQARSIVQGSTYQRLISVKDAMNDRSQALRLVQAIGNIIAHGMRKGSTATPARQLNIVSETIEKLETNGNVRLQLLSLALSL